MTNTKEQKQELSIVLSKPFYKAVCDFYKSKNQQYYLTREQIGTALEYSNPQVAIGKIHDRNADRLDKFSTLTTLVNVEGTRKVSRETIGYTLKGIMEICRFSRQPKADEFMDFVWDIMESLFNKESKLVPTSANPLLEQSIMRLQSQQGNIIDCLNQQGYAMLDLEEQIGELKNNTISKSIELISTPVEINKKDLIRSTINPLAEKSNDITQNTYLTYHKVYVAMNVNWKYRMTRYMNLHKLKNAPNKITLISEDEKLLELFQDTVEKMLQD